MLLNARRTAALSALLLTTTFAACTSSTQTCKNGTCDMTLSGKGSSMKAGSGDDGSLVTFVSSKGDTAVIKVGSESATLTKGQAVSLNSDGTATIELTEVEADKVKLQFVETDGSSDSSSDSAPADAAN
jgi:hypothetical protein